MGNRPWTERNRIRFEGETWCQAPPSQPVGSSRNWPLPPLAASSDSPSFQTCLNCFDESPFSAVTSGAKKMPPPHIEPLKTPLDSSPWYRLAFGQVLASSMIPYCSWARWAGSVGPLGMWATEISFGADGLLVSQMRTVGRNAYLSTVLIGSSTISRGSA